MDISLASHLYDISNNSFLNKTAVYNGKVETRARDDILTVKFDRPVLITEIWVLKDKKGFFKNLRCVKEPEWFHKRYLAHDFCTREETRIVFASVIGTTTKQAAMEISLQEMLSLQKIRIEEITKDIALVLTKREHLVKLVEPVERSTIYKVALSDIIPHKTSSKVRLLVLFKDVNNNLFKYNTEDIDLMKKVPWNNFTKIVFALTITGILFILVFIYAVVRFRMKHIVKPFDVE